MLDERRQATNALIAMRLIRNCQPLEPGLGGTAANENKVVVRSDDDERRGEESKRTKVKKRKYLNWTSCVNV